MHTLDHLFLKNQAWARARVAEDPDFFQRLESQQRPDYLWIGCADSRVPANEILGLPPGEVFVHRNVANVVVHSDFNCLAVMQFAVEVLKVKHIMVVGHYGCGGVGLALRRERIGMSDNWLRHVRDVADGHWTQLSAVSEDQQHDRLCELNAVRQVLHVGQTTVVEDAWQRGQPLSLHAMCYSLKDGLLRDLGMTVDAPTQLAYQYERAVERIFAPDR
ncbi:carbonate dehydratase [Solimonas marina]|uniref:Carbonic anhydrase n=1 Tax=Solimonas marina TaxID=2714601 RepID=A0A969W794_9GAMM|nr:carbonate dehydratase [Solimonas marina]NKF21986.1 carbonate dehydratase [Solimonas marina]